MRRVIGLTLAGLGAFLLVVAVFLPTYVAGQVIKYPLNEYLETTLEGTGVSYFSPSMVKPVSGATIRVTSTVKGDAAAGTSSTAVWNTFTYLYDLTNSAPFEFSSRRFAFDRRSAELVNCCGANVNGNTAIRQSGLVGFLWPIGTRQTTYQVFDSGLNKPRPARFAGTGTVDGIKVDKFVEHVPRTKSGTQAVPGALIGLPGSPVVTLTEYYTATNTFYVDPVTGAQLNTHEDQEVTIQDATGAHRLLLFDGILTTTPPSIRAAVALDNTGRSELTLLRVIIPLACGLAGVVALAGGILLARRREDDRPDTADAQPGLDPAPAP